MKKQTIFTALSLVVLAISSMLCHAQSNGYVASPLVFDRYRSFSDDSITNPQSTGGLDCDINWLNQAQRQRSREAERRYNVIVNRPDLVKYNSASLPDAPQDVTIAADPSRHQLAIEQPATEVEAPEIPLDRRDIKLRNWIHILNGSLHFTQAYISSNWYQGGENNLNVLGDIKWDFNLNTTLHPNWLFNNTLHYKIGITKSHNDELRDYTLNEDLLEFSSQLGYKAVKHWYYSANLLFKTQIFNNYKSNTNDMTASWLSPAELTLGLGMTYDYKDPDGIKIVTVSIAPLSYNMKICRDITHLNPTTFGIDAGHHTKHNIGSNIEGKFQWKITPNIEWQSRVYVFTNYKYVQSDWENTLNFTINRYLSTKIFTHLRYDKSHTWDDDWRFWQFKEILSFGLTYKFSTSN